MSVEYTVWQLNEINRRILEKRIWSGAYEANLESEWTAHRRAELIDGLRSAQTHFDARDLIDECAAAYAADCVKPHLIAGIRVAV